MPWSILGAGEPGATGTILPVDIPLTSHPMRTHAGTDRPFFASLLPEGRRLSSLRRAVKTSADQELSLLLAVGATSSATSRLSPRARSRALPSPCRSPGRPGRQLREGALPFPQKVVAVLVAELRHRRRSASATT